MLVAGSRARVKSNPCLRFKLLTARLGTDRQHFRFPTQTTVLTRPARALLLVPRAWRQYLDRRARAC